MYKKLSLAIFVCLLAACGNNNTDNTIGAIDKLPIEVQKFSLDSKSDQVFVGQGGTLLLFEKGCFMRDGKVIEDENIDISFGEVLDAAAIIKNNIVTECDGKMIETVGMVYLDAKDAKGNRLQLNPKKSVEFRVPAASIKENIQSFSGKLDKKGNLAWTKPEEQKRWLTPIPFNELDFSFKMPRQQEDYGSKEEPPVQKLLMQDTDTTRPQPEALPYCGLNESYTKNLTNPELGKTLIATQEFLQRMQFIHRSCEPKVLELYLKNLDKNMWEIDLLAAALLEKQGDAEIAENFKKFSQLKCLTMRGGTPKVSMKNIAESWKRAEEAVKVQAQEELISYSFQANGLGWINCDRFMRDNIETIKAQLSVEVSNLPKGAKVIQAVLVFQSIESFKMLDSVGTSKFQLRNYTDAGMMVPPNEKVIAVISGLHDGKLFMAHQAVTLSEKEQVIKLVPEMLSDEDFKKRMAMFSAPKKPGEALVLEGKSCCDYNYDDPTLK